MLKLGDTVKLKTVEEITGGWTTSPDSEMSKWCGCIGKVILIASPTKVIVNFTDATDAFSCRCSSDWLELQNRAGEVILSEEVMNLI